MIRALLLASFALALPADALAAKRECLTLEQVQDRYPGRHAKYRSVHGHRWWFVGRTPAKSEFNHCGERKTAKKSRDAGANGGVEVVAQERRATAEPPSRLVDGRTSTATDDHGRDFAGGREPGTISADGVDEVLRILCPRGCLEARGKINPRTPQWQNMSSAAGMIMLRGWLDTLRDEPVPVPVRTISYKRRP